jgi:hypothetical protein
MRLTDKAFLVAIDCNHFVVRIDGGEVTTSQVPSFCAALSYQEADAVIRRLRARGSYRLAYVANTLGQPITAEMLRNSQAEAVEVPLPETRAELDQIPSGEYKRPIKTKKNFASAQMNWKSSLAHHRRSQDKSQREAQREREARFRR